MTQATATNRVNAVTGSLCWFDTFLTFRTRSGKRVEATPLDITHNADIDPIVGVIARHAYVELGFRFLMRDILADRPCSSGRRCLGGHRRAPAHTERFEAGA